VMRVVCSWLAAANALLRRCTGAGLGRCAGPLLVLCSSAGFVCS
jgi:hypothetical protein